MCSREKEGHPLRTEEKKPAQDPLPKKRRREMSPEERSAYIAKQAAKRAMRKKNRKEERGRIHQEALASSQKTSVPFEEATFPQPRPRAQNVIVPPRRKYDPKVLARRKARSQWRALMRQIKKVVSFAERQGKNAKDIFCMLVAFLAGRSKQRIPVRKWQKMMLA